MNRTDSCLDRLFRAARPATFDPPLPSEAPFGLESRILAAWRGTCEEGAAMLVPLMRGAFACACAILVISGVLALRSWKDAPPDVLVSVDSAIQLTLTQ